MTTATIDPDGNDRTLIPSNDMLVEVAYPDDQIAHSWGALGGPERTGRATVKCTYCIRNGDERRYPAHEVMVVRHWKSNTPKDPDAGWWAWYCPEHFAATAPWPSSLLAPTHLIPADLEARIAADRQAAARAEADEAELLAKWNTMAREDGLPVVSRTGVAFAAYRLSIEELAELAEDGE